MSPRERKRRPRAEKRRSSQDSDEAVREELIASLVAGTIAPLQRTKLLRYLAENPEAREILLMAHRALDSERMSKHR